MSVLTRLCVVILLFGCPVLFLLAGGVETWAVSPSAILGITFVPPLALCALLLAGGWVGAGRR